MLRVDHVSTDGKLIKSWKLRDGLNLKTIARRVFGKKKFSIPTIAIVGTRPAVMRRGDWKIPLKGAVVQFRELAMGGGGGGSNPVQMVLQIAIIAAAAAATWWLGGEGGYLAAMGMGLTTANTLAAVAGAGIMMLGTLLMGALYQQKLPQGQIGGMSAEQSSPTYSINASGNQARLYQCEPECFGQMKIVPDFVANTWTMYVGNDQIGYFVYGITRGHCQVESLQFGETVFWRNGKLVEGSGYEILELEIVEPGNPVTIFPDNVVTSDEVAGQTLFAPNDEEFDGAVGPYTTNAPGTETNRLLFDFVFQQGLGTYDEEGNLWPYKVTWRIDYRKIDDYGNPLSGWAVLDSPSLEMGTRTAQRITKTYSVAKGRYEVRIVRTSETTGDGMTFDALTWGAMRAMLPGTYQYPITCIAFSVKANNALTQAASRQFSAIVTRKLPLYDRKTRTWSAEVPTRSWAAAVSHVCKCEWGGRLKDENIDLDTLWSIEESLQRKGWRYDSYIDGPYLVWNLLCEMCQSQCVLPKLVGPILSFVQDGPNRRPTFALTPRNIVRNTFGVTYMTWSDDTPDDVTMEYLDSAYGFQQRDVTAKLPESENREPSSLDVLGITDREHAFRVAVAYAAHNRWQRIVVECQVEALGRIINKGDICTVAHPRFRNTQAGAVKWWDRQSLTIGVSCDMTTDVIETAPDLYISFSRPDGSIWGPCKVRNMNRGIVALDSGDYSTLLMQGQGDPFEWFTNGIDRQPTAWTLYTAQTYQRLMIVDSVSAQDMLHYNLRLLNYDDRIYQYDNLPVPAWQGRGQLPSYDSIGVPQGLRGIVVNTQTLTLVWVTVAGAVWYDAEISVDNTNWRSLGRANINQITATVSPGRVYARVRASTETLQGNWATWTGDTTIGPPAAPDPQISQAYIGGSATISWSAVPGATGYAIALKRGNASIYVADVSGTSFQITPEIQQGGPYRSLAFSIYAKGAGGRSADAVINISDPAPQAPTSALVVTGPNSAVLQSVSPTPSGDYTGYIIAEGSNAYFTQHEIVASRRTATLPYTWSNLEAGTHYFRVAVTDAFYDIARNALDLNWSAVLTVEIGE